MPTKYKHELPTPWWEIWVIFIAVAVLLFLFTGCYTEKKAIDQAKKGIVTYPVPVSQVYRTFFPCITTGHTSITDSSAYKSSLDSLTKSKEFYEALITELGQPIEHDPKDDSVCNKYLQEIERLNKVHQYDTDYIIDVTDRFNLIEPIVINHYDTIIDKGEVMEAQAALQGSKNEIKEAKGEIASKEKKIQKWFACTVRLGISSIIELLIIIGLIWLLFQKKKANIL